ncbi:MAG: thermostable hemolysin delta-VPH [Clostridiales bacterium]|nr:thermostable hemolysin delta-VPH [Clostridiales bacterium]
MPYFNYHATAKTLIKKGKLLGYYFTEKYNAISPALVLLFDDKTHPVMPIREYRFSEYLDILPKDKLIKK